MPCPSTSHSVVDKPSYKYIFLEYMWRLNNYNSNSKWWKIADGPHSRPWGLRQSKDLVVLSFESGVWSIEWLVPNIYKTLDSIGGSRGRRRPFQILSFWHTNFLKRSHLGSWCPPYEVGAPLQEILDPPLDSVTVSFLRSLYIHLGFSKILF